MQVLASFAGVPDPEDDEGKALVMDVFAAPYVTALKTCLAEVGASPPVAHAAALAGDVLVSGMLDEDGHSCEVRPCRPCELHAAAWHRGHRCYGHAMMGAALLLLRQR